MRYKEVLETLNDIHQKHNKIKYSADKWLKNEL